MGRLSIEEEIEVDEEGGYFSRVPPETPPPPRRSFHKSSSSLTSVLSFVSSKKSFSYDKLSGFPIQLTIVKLDLSSFEIEVTKTAAIAELKQAVEDRFSHLPTEGSGKISWQEVWEHFCLSYGGQKLLNDSETIKDYGIKDGDELHFVRHVSGDTLVKKQSKRQMDSSKTYTATENKVELHQEEEDTDDLERCQQYKHKVEDNSPDHERGCSLFKGWFQYSRISSMEDPRSEGNTGSRRWGGGFVGLIRIIFHTCGNRRRTYSSRVSQVEI